MNQKKTHIFACDEHGNYGWPGGTKKFVFGGFVIDQNQKHLLISEWDEIKTNLCGSKKVELKWKHFFPTPQHIQGNPLKSKDPKILENQLHWALKKILNGPKISAIIAIVHKDEASNHIFEEINNKIIDLEFIFSGILAQFMLHLLENNVNGEI
jgi:hypothetical protein